MIMFQSPPSRDSAGVVKSRLWDYESASKYNLFTFLGAGNLRMTVPAKVNIRVGFGTNTPPLTPPDAPDANPYAKLPPAIPIVVRGWDSRVWSFHAPAQGKMG